MMEHDLRRAITTLGRYYVVSDFIIGPMLVAAGFLGAVIFEFGIAATWRGVPAGLVIPIIGLAWVAIGKVTWSGLLVVRRRFLP